MSKTTSIQTSLVDRRVQITIGNDPAKLTSAQKDFCEENKKEARVAVWRYWGDYGTVRAVYQGDEKAVMTMVEMEETGDIIEVHLAHLKVPKAEKTNPAVVYIIETGSGDLEAEVNKRLAKGWRLHGTVVVDTDDNGTQYIQALTR